MTTLKHLQQRGMAWQWHHIVRHEFDMHTAARKAADNGQRESITTRFVAFQLNLIILDELHRMCQKRKMIFVRTVETPFVVCRIMLQGGRLPCSDATSGSPW